MKKINLVFQEQELNQAHQALKSIPVRRFACDLECIKNGNTNKTCSAGVSEIDISEDRPAESNGNASESIMISGTKILGMACSNQEDVLTEFFDYLKSFATFNSTHVQTNEIVFYFHNAKYV